eukprot:CAMPEP_0113881556 /NCGR_PEP_ID=MMETSP0780_2-20120614/8444_1 /TAXON_ID=652834 /ORGANISM="Palpitomonas bilix" /LENGTH=669 /DNA_ID=CAMNT_0000868431 /DNA_START=60 /DNA_END=2069 /DNA_ORIENTATION=+ /assembly_acc=CAM_ASM_000599
MSEYSKGRVEVTSTRPSSSSPVVRPFSAKSWRSVTAQQHDQVGGESDGSSSSSGEEIDLDAADERQKFEAGYAQAENYAKTEKPEAASNRRKENDKPSLSCEWQDGILRKGFYLVGGTSGEQCMADIWTKKGEDEWKLLFRPQSDMEKKMGMRPASALPRGGLSSSTAARLSRPHSGQPNRILSEGGAGGAGGGGRYGVEEADMPEPRSGHGLFSLPTDIEDHPALYMFGGCNSSNGKFFNDIWRYDIGHRSWSDVPFEYFDSPASGRGYDGAVTVSGRWNFSCNAANAAELVIIFGGETSNYVPTDDLLLLDPRAWVMERATTVGESPAARSLHASTTLGRKTYIMGGTGGPGSVLTDMWELDVEVLRWTQLSSSSSSSSAAKPSTITPFHDGVGRLRPLLGASAFSLDDEHVIGLYGGKWEGGTVGAMAKRGGGGGVGEGGEREEEEERRRREEEEAEEEQNDSEEEGGEEEVQHSGRDRSASSARPPQSRTQREKERREEKRRKQQEKLEKERKRREKERERIPDVFSSLLWTYDIRAGQWTRIRIPEAENKYEKLLSRRTARSSSASPFPLPPSRPASSLTGVRGDGGGGEYALREASEEVGGEFSEIQGRWKAAAAFDPVEQRLLLHGGMGGKGILKDGWELDMTGVIGGDVTMQSPKRVSWVP